jgi:hypothetical protein
VTAATVRNRSGRAQCGQRMLRAAGSRDWQGTWADAELGPDGEAQAQWMDIAHASKGAGRRERHRQIDGVLDRPAPGGGCPEMARRWRLVTSPWTPVSPAQDSKSRLQRVLYGLARSGQDAFRATIWFDRNKSGRVSSLCLGQPPSSRSARTTFSPFSLTEVTHLLWARHLFPFFLNMTS